MLVFRCLGILREIAKENFGPTNMLLAAEILEWVVITQGRLPLKDLYSRSRLSEPTLRVCLHALAEAGLLTMVQIEDDARLKHVRCTPRLEQLIAEANERLASAARLEVGHTLAPDQGHRIEARD